MTQNISILQFLKFRGALTSLDLQKLTNLSQAQVSRHLKSLEPEVIKIGKGKNTKYVLTRDIPQVGSKISIYCVSEQGELTQRGVLYPVFPKGFYWASLNSKQSTIYDDLPYFLNDLRPSGYLGRLIPKTYPDWGFPEDIRLWTAESTLKYITHFGTDLIGNYIVGERAAEKFLNSKLLHSNALQNEASNENHYDTLAQTVEQKGIPGSSAGGEHPKFTTSNKEEQVLVKFVQNTQHELTKRRIDLLIAEHTAAKLFKERNQASCTRILRSTSYTFLEVSRFDRVGLFGRKGLLSLLSLDAEFLGSGESWSIVAEKLFNKKIISQETLNEIVLREYFGHMIGNSDMHSGNLSFYFEEEKVLNVSPLYDMLPMRYAPMQDFLYSGTITPIAPRPSYRNLWREAVNLAAKYWNVLQKEENLSCDFKKIAELNETLLKNML